MRDREGDREGVGFGVGVGVGVPRRTQRKGWGFESRTNLSEVRKGNTRSNTNASEVLWV
jgi:hypothetical protein